jgi:serine/threonine protein kinase
MDSKNFDLPKSFLENTEYDIISSIGGNNARKLNTVLLVKSTFSQQQFILKSIDKLKKEASAIQLLKNESEFNFSSSSLPQIINKFEDDHCFAILLKYKEGITLQSYFKKLRRIQKIPFIIDFIKKLAPIFEELKEKNIVHGDIRPSNFIIHELENDFEVNLIDFGLSFQANTLEKRKIIFPLAYCAPELILNKLNLANQQVDFFSLGLTIYYLLAGEFPFSHPNPAVLTNLQLTYPISNKAEINKDVFKIIEKSCIKPYFAKPPNQLSPENIELAILDCQKTRYQHFTEILEDLEKINIKASHLKRLIKIFTNS